MFLPLLNGFVTTIDITNFSRKYIIMCKVYTDLGGIKGVTKACGLSLRTCGQTYYLVSNYDVMRCADPGILSGGSRPDG